jgi:hypothetical protein
MEEGHQHHQRDRVNDETTMNARKKKKRGQEGEGGVHLISFVRSRRRRGEK